ncbi:DNA repair rad14 [Hyphodiscus hymeniophilus]|uniref:DNA repair rad14 n=1 Tax=Hyphodiscus hymeniophilus TaxID=353542 RepID=A0A9P6VHL7_9HELO|nr:DNA repair rad14 [Hyphodiscus hymeniophilus]
MDRQSTPPLRRAPRPTPISPPTPEVTRRIEENRLKAKAIREQSIIKELASENSTKSRTSSGFIATSDISVAGRKRNHDSISSAPVPPTSAPDTVRDASKKIAADEGIQAARKFKKYVDHDFSKMTDTKGGFLSVEDDPFNKALHAPEKDGGKPAHMTLKEWENMQLIKQLRSRREGPFEPGLSVLNKKGKKCRECGSLEIDWQWEEVFGCCVCSKCKAADEVDEEKGGKYTLLTKTQVKEDYLLTDHYQEDVDSITAELRDEELLPHLKKPNPHKSHWHDMMLFLRYQVEEYAFSKKKWGGESALDAEYEKRVEDAKTRKTKKFEAGLKELKKRTMTDAFKRRLKDGKKPGQFGDAVGSGRHEHEWGVAVENEDGATVKSCVECGMEVEELEF